MNDKRVEDVFVMRVVSVVTVPFCIAVYAQCRLPCPTSAWCTPLKWLRVFSGAVVKGVLR
jgi:hypothetical protein